MLIVCHIFLIEQLKNSKDMKQLFTLLITIGLVNFAFGTSTVLTMTADEYQLIVDYSNDQGTNTSEYSDNTDDYYGASAYYENYDFRDGKWDNEAFATWQDAVKESVELAVLPSKFPEATTDDTISVYFDYYDGDNTITDYFIFVCTESSPDPVFSAYESDAGNYKSDILTFSLEQQVAEPEFDYSAKTIDVVVAPGTDVTALSPEITISEAASIDPQSGIAVDFSNAVEYTVTAEDPSISTVWTVTVTAMEETITPIYEIQYVEDPATNDSSAYVDKTVIIEGIVTGFASGSSYNKIFVQDGDGEWDGIYVFDPNTGVVATMGDKVKVTGTVTEYYNLTEIEATSLEVVSGRNTQPEPIVVSEPITEPLEGVVVTLKGATISEDTSDDSRAFLLATKDGIEYKVFDEIFNAVNYEDGKEYDITGVVTYTYDNYRICPRSASDIVGSGTSVKHLSNAESLKVYPNPAQNYLNIEGANIDSVTIINIAGQTVNFQKLGNNRIDVTNLVDGVYFIRTSNKVTRFIKK
jgi:hypothetical protein